MAILMGEVFEILLFHSLLCSLPVHVTALILVPLSHSRSAHIFPQGFQIPFSYSESVTGLLHRWLACTHFQVCCAT